MNKIIILLFTLTFSSILSAQENSEEKAIKQTIETFFKGLHNGDSTLVSSTMHPSIKIQTTYNKGKDEKKLVTDSRKKILTGIANKKPENKYFEKLLSWNINIDGNLASVWTPYEFYFNDNFSHCGANSFQLFNNNGKWQIIYLVDMRRSRNCTALKNKK